MTDARAGRVAGKALLRTTGAPPASAARVAAKVLVQPNTPAQATTARLALKVLVRRSNHSWWDGTTKQPANLLGWWDGAQIRPISSTMNT